MTNIEEIPLNDDYDEIFEEQFDAVKTKEIDGGISGMSKKSFNEFIEPTFFILIKLDMKLDVKRDVDAGKEPISDLSGKN